MKPFEWGILGTGTVARKFAAGLRTRPDMRVGAVASRSAGTAQEFASVFGVPATFTRYDEAILQAKVDAFYIATPPTTHRELALACIAARKPVLIEKPFTDSAASTREIVDAARAAKTFCMEAMWTRFLPSIRKAKALVDAGEIGDIRMITCNFGRSERVSPENNLFSASLGGGVLLDRAVYPVSLAVHLLGVPEAVTGDVSVGETGVDEQAALVMRYAGGVIVNITASLRTLARNEFTIMGSRGQINIDGPIYRPFRMTLTHFQDVVGGNKSYSKVAALKENSLVLALYQRASGFAAPFQRRSTRSIPAYFTGNGYHYEAAEVMRCVREGLMESPLMPMSETCAVMDIVGSLRARHVAPVVVRSGVN